MTIIKRQMLTLKLADNLEGQINVIQRPKINCPFVMVRIRICQFQEEVECTSNNSKSSCNRKARMRFAVFSTSSLLFSSPTICRMELPFTSHIRISHLIGISIFCTMSNTSIWQYLIAMCKIHLPSSSICSTA